MAVAGGDTARVTLFDGGDMVYGNNVKNESPSLDWINGRRAMAADVGGEGKGMLEGRRGVVEGGGVNRLSGVAEGGGEMEGLRSSGGKEKESGWT